MIKNHIPAPTPIAMMAAKTSQIYSGLFHFYQFENESKCFEVNRYRRKRPKVDASIFDLALSHTRRPDASEKREEKSVSTFGRFRLWTSFESSPLSVKINDLELKLDDSSESDGFFFLFLLFLIHKNLF